MQKTQDSTEQLTIGLIGPHVIDSDLAEVLYGDRASELIVFFYRRTQNADVAAELLAETFATAALIRRRDPEFAVDDHGWVHNIARLELSRYFSRLHVDLVNVSELAMFVPRLTPLEAASLDAEVRALCTTARLGV